MNRLKVIGVAAATLAVMLLAVQPAAAVPARGAVAATSSSGDSAADLCTGFSWSDRDPGSAQIVNPVSGISGVAMRTGPHTYCDLEYRVPWTHWVVLDCYTSGSTVNGVSTWSHVRYNNGGPVVYSGWISDYHLSDRGSNFRCPG
jgi:hypothetical protein